MARKQKVDEVLEFPTVEQKKMSFSELLDKLDEVRGSDNYYEKGREILKGLDVLREYVPSSTKQELANDLVKNLCYDGDEFKYNSTQLYMMAEVTEVILYLKLDWDFLDNTGYFNVWDAIQMYSLSELITSRGQLCFVYTVRDFCDDIINDIEKNTLSIESQLRGLLSSISSIVEQNNMELSEVINSEEFVRNLADQLIEETNKQ